MLALLPVFREENRSLYVRRACLALDLHLHPDHVLVFSASLKLHSIYITVIAENSRMRSIVRHGMTHQWDNRSQEDERQDPQCISSL